MFGNLMFFSLDIIREILVAEGVNQTHSFFTKIHFFITKIRVFIEKKFKIMLFWDLTKQWYFHEILVLNLRFQSKLKKDSFVQFLWFTSKFQKCVVFWKTYKTFRNKNNWKKRVRLVNPYVPQVVKWTVRKFVPTIMYLVQ